MPNLHTQLASVYTKSIKRSLITTMNMLFITIFCQNVKHNPSLKSVTCSCEIYF